MSDPKRWMLDGAGSSREERDLLRSAAGAKIDPPDGSKARIWASLVAQIGPGGGGGNGGGNGAGNGSGNGSGNGGGNGSGNIGGHGGGASPHAGSSAGGTGANAGAGAGAAGGGGSSVGAGAAAGGGVLKAVIIGAASACVVIAGYAAFGPRGSDTNGQETTNSTGLAQSASISPPPLENEAATLPPAVVPAPTPSAAPLKSPSGADRAQSDPHSSPAPGTRAPSGESEDEAHSTPTPAAGDEGTPQAAASSAPTDRASRLREESQLLSEARDALRRGDPAAALRKLEDARTRFAGGVLSQEREALTIEALYKGGQRAAAADRAASFLRAYPLSPHATRVQQFAR